MPPARAGNPLTWGLTAALFVALSSCGPLEGQAAPTVPWVALADAYLHEPYDQLLSAEGSASPLRWRLAAGALPPGISLSEAGQLAGSAEVAGRFLFTVEAEDPEGRLARRGLELRAWPQVALSTRALSDGLLGAAYLQYLVASGGRPPHRFQLQGLPPGLALFGEILTGTPSAGGTFSVRVQASDGNGRTVDARLELRVHEGLTVTTPALPDAYTAAPYSGQLTAIGGRAPLNWSIAGGAWPEGLWLSSGGGLGGIPAAPGEASFTVQVTDADGASSQRALLLRVLDPPVFTTPALPSGVEQLAYSESLLAEGGAPPLRFSSPWGHLPPGLFIDAAGVLSGIPTTQGTYEFALRILDANGAEGIGGFEVVVSPSDPEAPKPPLGLAVATWNLLWFGAPDFGPSNEALQLRGVRDVILLAGAPLWGLQEVIDEGHFQALLAQLPGHEGFLANDARVEGGAEHYDAAWHKVGVIYRPSLISIDSAQVVLGHCAHDFARRPPLQLRVTASHEGAGASFLLLVLHLEASSGASDYDRRLRSIGCLAEHLAALDPAERVLVIGDFNDDVDVSIVRASSHPGCVPEGTWCQTPLLELVESEEHHFVTSALSARGLQSTVFWSEMIDHQLASTSMVELYEPKSAAVLRPDLWGIAQYGQTTSDHYPVLTRFVLPPGFTP